MDLLTHGSPFSITVFAFGMLGSPAAAICTFAFQVRSWNMDKYLLTKSLEVHISRGNLQKGLPEKPTHLYIALKE